jgi:uncharacterized membrane protein
MMKLSDEEAWVACAASALFVGVLAGWVASWKAAVVMLPVSGVGFLVIVGSSLARHRPLGDASLLYVDAMSMLITLLFMLKRLFVTREYIESDRETKLEMGRKYGRKLGFVSCAVALGLLLVEYIV